MAGLFDCGRLDRAPPEPKWAMAPVSAGAASRQSTFPVTFQRDMTGIGMSLLCFAAAHRTFTSEVTP